MTYREIREALPQINKNTLYQRLLWGWRTMDQLRLPPKPGRFSPWRSYNPAIGLRDTA